LKIVLRVTEYLSHLISQQNHDTKKTMTLYNKDRFAPVCYNLLMKS